MSICEYGVGAKASGHHRTCYLNREAGVVGPRRSHEVNLAGAMVPIAVSMTHSPGSFVVEELPPHACHSFVLADVKHLEEDDGFGLMLVNNPPP